MKHFCTAFILLFAFSFSIYAQSGQNYQTILLKPSPMKGIVSIKNINNDFFPLLQSAKEEEMPKPGGKAYNEFLKQLKLNASANKTGAIYSTPIDSSISPVSHMAFSGNSTINGVPNDNDLAISNGGKIVSVVNSNVCVLDTNGNILKQFSLDALSDTLKLSAGKYDPRVLYDPAADRFIIAYLSGSTHNTSNIIFAFSQTNDPLGLWNLYSFNGNPVNDTTWSDYPIIALTNGELFLTVNGVKDSVSWQLGFHQTYIYQINKAKGYAGDSLVSRLYTGVKFNGANIRNICPAKGGSQLYGPDIYLVSDKNFSKMCDSVFLLHISGQLGDTSTKLTVKLLHSGTPYGLAPDAMQPSKGTLATNDSRVLDAFYENNKVQFVGNSLVPATGLAGVYHGIISNPDTAAFLNMNIIGHPYLEYGYPAIAYAGRNKAEDDAMIVVNYSADTVYCGNSAMLFKNGAYSPVYHLQSGKNQVNYVTGKSERWGDYSGAQRRYNAPGEVWVSAAFARSVKDGFFNDDIFGTWISELENTTQLAGIQSQNINNNIVNGSVYPNPAPQYQNVHIDFTLKTQETLLFYITDLHGKIVKNLLTDNALPGKNTFSFVTNPLAPGMYIIYATGNGKTVIQKKFVVE